MVRKSSNNTSPKEGLCSHAVGHVSLLRLSVGASFQILLMFVLSLKADIPHVFPLPFKLILKKQEFEEFLHSLRQHRKRVEMRNEPGL